jgi:FixJ family two-component response regulator
LSQVPVIAIVDDDQSVRAAMGSIVRSLGYKVELFAAAEAFLASPRLRDTHCLIVDVQMPGMSGLDLQDELRTRQAAIPVIFITAFPEEHIQRRAEAGGAKGFFGKPVDGHAIIRCLEATLQGR